MTQNEPQLTFLEWFAEQPQVGKKLIQNIDHILQNRHSPQDFLDQILSPEDDKLTARAVNTLLRRAYEYTRQKGLRTEFEALIAEASSRTDETIRTADAFEKLFHILYVPLSELRNRANTSKTVSASTAEKFTSVLQDIVLSTLGQADHTDSIHRTHDLCLVLDAASREEYGKHIMPAMEAATEGCKSDLQSSQARQWSERLIEAQGANILTNPQTTEQADNLLLRTLIRAELLPGKLQN